MENIMSKCWRCLYGYISKILARAYIEETMMSRIPDENPDPKPIEHICEKLEN